MKSKEQEEAEALLGQFVDLSIKGVQIKMVTRFTCRFCGGISGPTEVRHSHGCIVARAKDFLQRNQPNEFE